MVNRWVYDVISLIVLACAIYELVKNQSHVKDEANLIDWFTSADVGRGEVEGADLYFTSMEDNILWSKAKQHRIQALIMVNVDCKIMQEMGDAIVATWSAPSMWRENFTVVKIVIGNSFVNNCANPELYNSGLLLHLPECPDSYPPVRKEICMWEHMRNHYLVTGRFSHYTKIDADTYLNIPNFIKVLLQSPSDQPLFVGHVGKGRFHETKPFCMGFGYYMTAELLGRLSPESFGNVNYTSLPKNSDTAFSSLVRAATNVSCHAPNSVQGAFLHRYVDFNGTKLVNRSINEKGQTSLSFVHGLTSAMRDAVVVHPLKGHKEMLKFHHAMESKRLPLFQFRHPVEKEKLKWVKHMCVHNPDRQYELNGIVLRECDSLMPSDIRDRTSIQAHMLYLPKRPYSKRRAFQSRAVLARYGVQVSLSAGVDKNDINILNQPQGPFNMTTGEVACLQSFTNVFKNILSLHDGWDDMKWYMILEDDVNFHPSFSDELDNVLTQSGRCGHFLHTPPGGALLLGGTVRQKGTFLRVSERTSGWNQYDKKMGKLSGSDKACYNVASSTRGMFAVIMTGNVVRSTVEWIRSTKANPVPVDHVWSHLSDLGYIVRALHPPLAFPTVDETTISRSSRHQNPRYRNLLHRWGFR